MEENSVANSDQATQVDPREEGLRAKVNAFKDWLRINFPDTVTRPGPTLSHITQPCEIKRIQRAALLHLGWNALDTETVEGVYYLFIHQQMCEACHAEYGELFQ
jgi:hypothetical protein